MRHPLLFCVVALMMVSPSALHADALESGFQNPPAAARPQVWWHWMDRNVTREGITADLEALHHNGIGGAQIFNLDYEIPNGSVGFATPEWFELMHHAAKEADRLGLELGLHNCSGWSSSGGPWVTPDKAMQMVVTSETRLNGPEHFHGKLALPEPPDGRFAEYYHEIAVLACPTPTAEKAGRGFRLPDVEFKAGFRVPKRTWTWNFGQELEAPVDAVYRKDQIIDLTASLKPDGTLDWDVPEGDWTILRFGYAPRARMNTHPEVPAGQGLEIDKMSRAALDFHFKSFLDRVVKTMGPLNGRSFTNLLIDSYEVGGQNWTAGFAEEFKRRRGYDLTPYLLTLTGRVVDSVEVTERFLWDFRRTIADLFHDNYWAYFTELCHKNGLQAATEPYEGPFSSMDNALVSDIPMTEFWGGPGRGISSARHRLVASGAHLDLKPIVGAEAFTHQWSNDRFVEYPSAMKALGDFHFCEGINRFYFHDFTHQPWVDPSMEPGMTMGPWGLHFARTVTWWDMSKAWMEYLARAQFLLQSGHAAADILCFTGEDAGLMPVWEKTGNLPPIPQGYDFDYVNASLLLGATVRDGRIVLPKGLEYRILALPDDRYLTLPVAKKLAELVKAGADVVGPSPTISPSLSDQGAGDAGIRRIATELWGDYDGKAVTEHAAGSGRVFWGRPLEDVLASLGVKPDFNYSAKPSADIVYKHRSTAAAEIYFISNQGAAAGVEGRFRVSGKRPELWHPDTGLIELAAVYHEADGVTTVPLQLDAAGSVFVIFRQPDEAEHIVSVSAPSPAYDLSTGDDGLTLNAWASGKYEFQTSKGRKLAVTAAALPAPIDLSENWDVSFPPNLGAPASIKLPSLVSLSRHPDDGVRYFSGTATYTKHFDIPPDMLSPTRDVYLDLGTVNYIARVKVNDTDLGIVWKAPFRVRVTPALRDGDNLLEVKVANVWANRLIGDEKLPDDREWELVPKNRGWRMKGGWPKWVLEGQPRNSPRVTFTTWKFYDGSETPPNSGLVGPVELHTVEKIKVPVAR